MGLKTETRELGDVTLTSTQLPAMRSVALLSKLGKAVAPALTRAAGLDTSGGLEGLDVSALAPALADLFDRLDPEEAQDLVRRILSGTSATMSGTMFALDSDERINTAFAGNIKGLLAACRFALEVNYGDFFGGALTAAREQKPQPEESPSK